MKSGERTVLDTIRVLDTKEVGHESFETCATAVAFFDDESRELRVELNSFVRHFEMRGKDQVFRPGWLPRADCVRTHVDLDEAPEAAREIAETWAGKVRRTIPSLAEWNAHPAWLTAIPTPA